MLCYLNAGVNDEAHARESLPSTRIANARNACRKKLHTTFIVMLSSSLLVLASLYPVQALQMLANYL